MRNIDNTFNKKKYEKLKQLHTINNMQNYIGWDDMRMITDFLRNLVLSIVIYEKNIHPIIK